MFIKKNIQLHKYRNFSTWILKYSIAAALDSPSPVVLSYFYCLKKHCLRFLGLTCPKKRLLKIRKLLHKWRRQRWQVPQCRAPLAAINTASQPRKWSRWSLFCRLRWPRCWDSAILAAPDGRWICSARAATKRSARVKGHILPDNRQTGEEAPLPSTSITLLPAEEAIAVITQ